MDRRRPRVLTLFGILATALLGSHTADRARADVIISPVGTTADTLGTIAGSLSHTYDGSGLPAFVSGTTDYDAYLGTNPVHATFNASNAWASAVGTTTGSIDYDLGTTYAISGLSLWNEGNAESINSFTILIADNSGFAGATNVGTFNALESTSASSILFGSTTGEFVRLQINSNYGDANFTTLGEIAVRAASPIAAVPEPSSIVHAGLTLVFTAIVVAKRRIRRRGQVR